MIQRNLTLVIILTLLVGLIGCGEDLVMVELEQTTGDAAVPGLPWEEEDGRGVYGHEPFTAYDDLPPEKLLEHLTSWSPIVRDRAGAVIGKKEECSGREAHRVALCAIRRGSSGGLSGPRPIR